MRCSNRKPVRHMYGPCRECPNNIQGYGKCRQGFDNYYERRTKKSACPKLNGQGSASAAGKDKNSDDIATR